MKKLLALFLICSQLSYASANRELNGTSIRVGVGGGLLTLPNTTDTLVGKATTDTLTNKTLTGNTAASLINGSGTLNLNSTGVITVPNATDTLIGKGTTDTLSNKTLTTPVITGSGGTLTLPAGPDTLVGRATTDTLTNKTLTTPVINNPSLAGSGGSLILPNGPDTLVGRATTDTLTNKTLTAPVISTITNTGTVTLPTATDTLVGKATTDTLTNKTLAAGSNTITGLTNTNFSGSAAITGANIATNTVSNTNTAQMTAHTYKGNNTGSTANAADISAANVLADTSPLTTKGDLPTFSTVNTRLGVGSDTQVLTADSSQTNGIKWAAAATAPTSGSQLSNVGLAVSIATSTLVIALKQADGSTDCAAGNSACAIGFRSATATTGSATATSVTAAASITLSATDSIGATASVAQQLYVYLVSDSGVEVCASYKLFDESIVQSATALTAGAEVTGTTLYCTSAHTSKPIRLIGTVTATWSNPNWGTIANVAVRPFTEFDTLASDGSRTPKAGQVGETITNTGGFTATNTSTPTTLATATLTAGVWLVSGSTVCDHTSTQVGQIATFQQKGNTPTTTGKDSFTDVVGAAQSTIITFPSQTLVVAPGDSDKTIKATSQSVTAAGSCGGWVQGIRVQ